MAELRTLVPGLPRQARWVVLHEGSYDRSGEFGAKRDPAAVLVLEVVHLLGDHIGRLTYAKENPELLKDRRHDVAVSGQARLIGKHIDESSVTLRIRRKNVASPAQSLKFGRSHGRSC